MPAKSKNNKNTKRGSLDDSLIVCYLPPVTSASQTPSLKKMGNGELEVSLVGGIMMLVGFFPFLSLGCCSVCVSVCLFCARGANENTFLWVILQLVCDCSGTFRE